MGLWGASDATEDQPKHFTTEEKEDIVANEHGWTVKAGSVMTGNDNTGADPEILVFIRGLDNKLGLGDITGMDWNISTFDKSAGGTLSVTVSFNEAVTVTGTPQLTVINDTNSNHTLSYASGSGTNALTFTLVIAAANAATDADDVLSIAANAMSLNSGTILDTSGDSVSAITAPEATVGSTTLPTVAINNGNATFATTAAVGAVTAKLFSFAVTTAGTGYTDGEDATIDLGTGTDPVLTIDGTTVTGAVIKTPGALTAITGATGLVVTGDSSGANDGRVSVTISVLSCAVTTAGTNYSGPPTFEFAGTGLVQSPAIGTMVGRASTITNVAGIGAAAGTITVVA
tara:strand:- start:277 stop:1308 length:1032 start_codon:yes stop_codon:yes gene_type:complete